jgi:hypothetical protein
VPPRKAFDYDWAALKREFLAGNETPNAFKDRKGIVNEANFWRRIKKDSWVAARKEIQDRATQEVADKLVEGKVEEFERQLKLYGAIENHVAHLLKKHVSPEGRIISDIDPFELKALAEIVSKSVVTRKQIKGETVMGEGGGGNTTINLHQTLVQVVNEVEKDGDPTPLDPPQLGHKRGG